MSVLMIVSSLLPPYQQKRTTVELLHEGVVEDMKAYGNTDSDLIPKH